MAAKIEWKYVALGTGDKDLNARRLPAYFDEPAYYVPVAIGAEGADKTSAHLKGIDAALGGRLLLSGGALTGSLDINAFSGTHGNSLRLTGSLKVGNNLSTATQAGDGVLRWTGSKFQFSKSGLWNDLLSTTVTPIEVHTYDFDAAPGGQFVFTASEDLTGKTVAVFHNGAKRREGEDYTISGSDVTFSYEIEAGEWVSIEVNTGVSTVFDFDVPSGGQATFTTTIDLTMKAVLVFEQGVKKRLGLARDYTVSGSNIVFNEPVPEGQWVQIIVF